MDPTDEEKIARIRDLRGRAKVVVAGVGVGRPFAEHVTAIAAMLGRPGVPSHSGVTTPRGLAQFARGALKAERAPREPETGTPGDRPIAGGKRRRIIKGEMPGQSR